MKKMYQEPTMNVFFTTLEDILTTSAIPSDPIEGSFWGEAHQLRGRT